MHVQTLRDKKWQQRALQMSYFRNRLAGSRLGSLFAR